MAFDANDNERPALPRDGIRRWPEPRTLREEAWLVAGRPGVRDHLPGGERLAACPRKGAWCIATSSRPTCSLHQEPGTDTIQVKILDFGLARLQQSEEASAQDHRRQGKHGDGNARLPVAGAVEESARCRYPLRPLQPWLYVLLPAHRRRPIPRRQHPGQADSPQYANWPPPSKSCVPTCRRRSPTSLRKLMAKNPDDRYPDAGRVDGRPVAARRPERDGLADRSAECRVGSHQPGGRLPSARRSRWTRSRGRKSNDADQRSRFDSGMGGPDAQDAPRSPNGDFSRPGSRGIARARHCRHGGVGAAHAINRASPRMAQRFLGVCTEDPQESLRSSWGLQRFIKSSWHIRFSLHFPPPREFDNCLRLVHPSRRNRDADGAHGLSRRVPTGRRLCTNQQASIVPVRPRPAVQWMTTPSLFVCAFSMRCHAQIDLGLRRRIHVFDRDVHRE